MARALLVADSLLTATIDNDAPETLPGQTSDDTLTSASEPHRAHGHGLDLPRLHAEKSMLKQEFVTETMPAQPRADAAHASGQAQEQVHAPSHDSAEPIADSAHVVADSLLHRNLLIDMGYGPDDEVGRPGDGNSNVDSNEESDDEHDGGDAAAQLRATALARRHQQLQEQAQQHAQQQTQLRTQQQEAGPGASGAKRERGERGGRKRKKKPGEKQARNEMAAGSTSGSTITATFALTQDAALREHAASVAGLSGEPKRHALRALELMSDTRARLLLAIEGASGRDEAEAFDSIAYVMRSAAGALQRRAGCIEQAKSDTLYRRERADVRHAQHDARQGQRGSAATHAGHASSSGDAGCGGKGGGGKDGGSKGGSSNDSGYPGEGNPAVEEDAAYCLEFHGDSDGAHYDGRKSGSDKGASSTSRHHPPSSPPPPSAPPSPPGSDYEEDGEEDGEGHFGDDGTANEGGVALPAVLPLSEAAVAAQAQPRAPQQRSERPARVKIAPNRSIILIYFFLIGARSQPDNSGHLYCSAAKSHALFGLTADRGDARTARDAGTWPDAPPFLDSRDAPGPPARELRSWPSSGCKSSGSAALKVLPRPLPRRPDAPLAGGMGGYRIGSSGRAPWHAPEGNLRGASVGGRTMRLMVRPHHTAGPPLLAAATDLPLLLH